MPCLPLGGVLDAWPTSSVNLEVLPSSGLKHEANNGGVTINLWPVDFEACLFTFLLLT